MSDKAILYDASKCTACRGCQAACKQWNERSGEKTTNRGSYENPPDLSVNTWLKMQFKEVSRNGNGEVAWLFNRRSCMHCTDAGCVTVCPTGALYHHELGFVAYDRGLCSGCGYCLDACPFNVPRIAGNTITGVRKMDKCHFCQDRVTQGLEPACVKSCPPGALSFGERGDLLLQADKRVKALKAVIDPLTGQALYPNATLYGDTQLEGLHVLYILPDSIDNYDTLPASPKVSDTVIAWQKYLQPVGYGVVGAVALGLLMNYMVARARMIQEKEGK
jgi:formate dehydrogenase iron-sulfur subunit